MLPVLVLLCLWPGDVKSKDVNQGWDRLIVGFPQFLTMPLSEREAENAGWIKNGSCEEKNVFVGNRYIKDNDKSTRLIFGNDGMVAGIQTTLPPTATSPDPFNSPIWIRDGNEAIATAYFRNPRTICRRNWGNSAEKKFSLGRQLYIQTKSWLTKGRKKTMRIPKNENKLKQKHPAWVEGKCFPGMGLHYWYNVSQNLECKDIFPMFLLYDKESSKLMSFGWSVPTLITSPMWEHPPPQYLSLFFNKTDDIPKCLMNEGRMPSTQHVYLRDPKKLACLK